MHTKYIWSWGEGGFLKKISVILFLVLGGGVLSKFSFLPTGPGSYAQILIYAHWSWWTSAQIFIFAHWSWRSYVPSFELYSLVLVELCSNFHLCSVVLSELCSNFDWCSLAWRGYVLSSLKLCHCLASDFTCILMGHTCGYDSQKWNYSQH